MNVFFISISSYPKVREKLLRAEIIYNNLFFFFFQKFAFVTGHIYDLGYS